MEPWLTLPRSSGFGDAFGHAFGSRDHVTQRCTWRPRSSKFGDALGGHDRSRLEEYLEVVNLEALDWEGGATAADILFIG
jgi:hypothetical protein